MKAAQVKTEESDYGSKHDPKLRQATLSFALALSFALSLTSFASKRRGLGEVALLQRHQNLKKTVCVSASLPISLVQFQAYIYIYICIYIYIYVHIHTYMFAYSVKYILLHAAYIYDIGTRCTAPRELHF